LNPQQSPPRTKREARIERKLERKLRQDEQSARLRERPENVAAVRAEKAPSERVVRYGADPGSIYHMSMAWNTDRADRKDSWSWGHEREWGYPAWNTIIHPKLKQFEQLLWREVESFNTDTGHRMHHSMEVDSICSESQVRLGDLGFDHDEIYRFRLGNKRRLWGFRFLNVFEILWYDPDHNIYPTDPD